MRGLGCLGCRCSCLVWFFVIECGMFRLGFWGLVVLKVYFSLFL